MIPAMMPIKAFWILSNASVWLGFSAIAGNSVVTTPVLNSFVIISQENQSCQSCRAVMIVSHSHRNAHCKQDRHGGAVHQRKRRLNHKISDQSGRSGDLASLHGRRAEQISDTGKDTCHRQTCYGKHQRLSKFLQNTSSY